MIQGKIVIDFLMWLLLLSFDAMCIHLRKKGKKLVFLNRRFNFLGVGNEGFLFPTEMEIPKGENPLFRQMRPNFFSSCKTLNGIHLCYIFR